MRQIESAVKKLQTKEMREVAKSEGCSVTEIMSGIASGTAVILKNTSRPVVPGFRTVGVGKGLSIKVNANIGTSPLNCDLSEEKRKLDIAIRCGTDAIMDLSTGGDIDAIRKSVMKKSVVPVGTVPIYGLICSLNRRGKKFVEATATEMLEEIEKHLDSGVDFVTIHCGLTYKALEILKKKKRLVGIVSRGGSFLAEWMSKNKKENPLYENYDTIVKLCGKYDAVISLGDGLRPGCIHDNTDAAQIQELKTLGLLHKYALKHYVQTMIEGPGHVPINNIRKNIELEKKYCKGAPFYVLGPLTTDIAPGYDHITGAIGGALAGYYGADFLCYVTPAEHLSLPDAKDVENGVIASKIAAHSADIARGRKTSLKRDYDISRGRKEFNWKKQRQISINPLEFDKRFSAKPKDVCSMCGEFCAMKRKI
ncbi:MAG: Phosphomethylpyrimidine synthase [Elusimicrobia bacterium ADurb.Bin231]|nr:MAG: Phosphomethylpyrimidine synthase [Elusimicrobia bacterium ADurb.Bin231]